MKVTFCLWLCSLQISAVVLLNITTGKNLLLEPQDSIETAQSLETTELPGLVNNKGQGFYRSDDGDDVVVDAEGQADDSDNEEDDNEDNISDDQSDKEEEGQPVNADAIRFLLFADPNDTETYERAFYGQNNSLRSSGFDPSKPTKILIHGFRGKHNGTFPKNVKEAYLETKSKNDYNVFVLDWRVLALPGPKSSIRHYPRAVKNVRAVADRLAAFIAWLKQDFDVNLDQVHLIGHSLGAHVAGNAGEMVIQHLGHAVGRITGLDPAGPEFYPKFQGTRRLHATDAQYVDVIHTNGGKLGIYKNIGAADFWVNPGAAPQPGCGSVKSTTELRQLVSGSCSHRMATIFYANTIRNHEDFEQCACSSRMKFSFGKKCCDRKVIFGEFSPAGTRGTFYMKYELANNVTKDNRTEGNTNKSGMKRIWNAVRRWFSSP